MHLPLGPLAGPLGRDLRGAALRDGATAVSEESLGVARTVVDADLAHLPETARRYLHHMGVVGRPQDRCFVVRFQGRFKRPGQPWLPCEAWQFNAAAPIVRLFHLRIDVARIVPMVGRDAYVAGVGSMKGKVLGLVTVADGSGPELDLGELVTYLNDAVLLAPSMLLEDAVRWTEVDDRSFDLTLTDLGRTVTARVFVDADGAVVDFSTEDRWCDLPDGLVRARWTTPVTGWTEVEGRPWPGRASAVWHLDEGPLPYIDGTFVAGSIVRHVAPAALLAGDGVAAR